MVYGRYNELVNRVYKPTFTSLGGTMYVWKQLMWVNLKIAKHAPFLGPFFLENVTFGKWSKIGQWINRGTDFSHVGTKPPLFKEWTINNGFIRCDDVLI